MTSPISDALAELSRQFSEQLPGRLDTIRTHFQRLDRSTWLPTEAEELHRLVHGLTGSAGTFGMMPVSDAARALEARLMALIKTGTAPTEAAWQIIGADLEHLDQLARIQRESRAPSLKPPPAQPRLNLSPLIHLVEGDPTQAEHLSQALRDDGYRIRVFTDSSEFCAACTAADTERPDAVVMDMIFPEGDTAGAELLAELKANKKRCPPVVFASVRDDLPARLAAFRAGASRYIAKPIGAAQLIDLLDALTNRQPAQPYRVLMVDDDPLLLEAQAAILRSAGMEVCTLSQPLQIMDVLNDFAPDVAVLDVYMPEASGPELAAVLRERDEQRHLPILFLSAETDMTQQLLALNLGGDDFLVKPVQPDHLISAVTARARRERQNSSIQHRLEATLYEREREHLALNQHAIVSIADRAGSITYVNDKFCEISGYSRGELMGRNHRLVKSGEHLPEFYQNLWRTIAGGKVWQGEICNRRKDGSLYWVESTITPFLNSDGKPYQYVSIRTDISHIKATEAALLESKERLRRGQVFANIGTWDWNIQTGELVWSERIAPLFGHPAGDLETSYDNFLAAIHPDDRQAVIDAVNACVERDVPYEIEHRVVWPDGTVRWLLERGAVVGDANGKPLQMLGVVQDIDDSKRAELALAESERQLREAQALARIGNWTADMVSGKLTWSDEIYRIFGHEPGSFAPNIEAFQAAVHPDDRTQVRESEKQAEQTGRHDVVHRIVRPDGTVRHVHELAQAETDAAGHLLRLTGTVQDITERVEAEQALIIARDEADRANQAKSAFLSSMSHELRTPMNAILGFGQLMEYDEELSDEHKDNVREILKAGHHLLELINEVLDLAKVESGHIDLSLEPVEVCPIVEECLNLVSPLADRRDIQFSHSGLKGAAVRADRMRLRQVLINLLSNAIKYNREGGSVRLDVRSEGADRLRILVTDTGQGIPAARLTELFQPFNRLDAENSGIEGTGIGLTITRRIVEMMGGTVDVESEVGVGSTFWIELPLESLPEPDHEGAAADSTTPAQHTETAQHTVLYIEDNPSNLRLMAQILGRRQHIHLLTAHTPELGIELALARRPELILLDINMPGMDGYQVLRVFKADECLKTIPVVAVTANAMPCDIERGVAAGFADYLTKPLDVARFYSIIDKLLWPHGE